MTGQTVTSDAAKGGAAITAAVKRFLETRQGARRFHKQIIGDVDPGYCFGDFLARIWAKDFKGLDRIYHAKSALNEASGTAGGYLVPQELQDHLLADVAEVGLFRGHAHCVEMASETLQLPYLDMTTVPAAAGVSPFWGGLKALPTEENAALTESEPAFRQLELTAHVVGGYALASRQLLDDGGATLNDWLYAAFARSMAWYEDWYCVNGTGLGQPLGLILAGASILATRAGTGMAVADAQAMLADFYAFGDYCCWLMSYTLLTDLVKFTGWIPNGPLSLYGFPVHPTTLQPARNTKGDAILVAPELYVLGWRPQIEIDVARDAPTAFQAYQDVWRYVERIDGSPLPSAPITLPDGGSNTVAMSVVLT